MRTILRQGQPPWCHATPRSPQSICDDVATATARTRTPLFSIVITYRESDAKAWAIALRDALALAFGDDGVFLDKDGLQAGPWPAQLQQAIRQCRVMLVVIGRHWLDATDDAGVRRLWAAGDVHRQEIELALAQPGVTVMPVRVDGVPMPQAKELPAGLAGLAMLQSQEIGDSQRRRAVDLAKIVADVSSITGLKPLDRHDGAPKPSPAGWLLVVASALLLTAATATFFSMASMPLKTTEWLVVMLLAIAASFSLRALWRRLSRRRRGV